MSELKKIDKTRKTKTARDPKTGEKKEVNVAKKKGGSK